MSLGIVAPPLCSEADTVRVAGIVLKWVPTEKEVNYRRAAPLIRQAAEVGARIVCTTECFLDGYAMGEERLSKEALFGLGEAIPGGAYFRRLSQLVDELDIYLVAGMLERDGERLYNTAAIIGPDGQLIEKYHKQKYLNAPAHVTPGHSAPTLSTSVGRLGTLICADRRFPDVVRDICSDGIDLLMCPSGGSYGRENNDTILQYRSRENGQYIVFVHPTEFLVTRPDGTIAARKLLGDRLDVEADDIDTRRDSRGVFYCDVPREKESHGRAALLQQLSEPILEVGETWKGFQNYVDAHIPRFTSPKSLADWNHHREELRKQVLDRVVFRGEAIRWREAPLRVRWFDDAEGGPDYRIRRFAYEAVPNLWVPALLYEPRRLTGKVPVILNVNGHDRTGKATSFKQRRCINLAKRGMLAVSLEFLGMGQLNDKESRGNDHNRSSQLDLCGTSGLAPFYLALERGLEVALAQEHGDPNRLGVTGLSGGGWQSIWLSALDPRIKLSNPVAGYCSMFVRSRRENNIGDAEQIPTDLCTVVDYTHLTAMVAPRPLLLTYNEKDNCCFLPPDVLPDLEAAARPVYRLFRREHLFRTHINRDPGTHNYEQDNREALYRLIGENFYPDDVSFKTADIDVPDSEIRTIEELAVPLPLENATMHSLAKELSKGLPLASTWPETIDAAERWQADLRGRLRRIVRLPTFQATADIVDNSQWGDLEISRLRLRLDNLWTLPAVDFRPVGAKSAVLVISDAGRRGLAGNVLESLADHERVLAVDLLNFGEMELHLSDGKNDDIALQLAATVGQRPLGILAAQLISVAHWIYGAGSRLPVKIVAVGPRSSVVALVAASLETEIIAEVELHHCWGSLHELVRENMTLQDAPELFCFGLLKEFDIAHLIATVAPRPVTVHDPSVKEEWHFSQLQAWYRLFGKEFTLSRQAARRAR